MFASAIFNKRSGNNFQMIFGCVTTGENWQFLKLENNIAIVDSERFYISEIENILGVFKTMFDFYED
jgi:hypothetical protein